MKVYHRGNFKNFPVPFSFRGAEVVKVLVSLKFKNPRNKDHIALRHYYKMVYARLSVALLSLRHDGIRETLDRAKTMSRREGLLDTKEYYSCFIGYINDDKGTKNKELVAGFSFKHLPHSEYTLARREFLFPLHNKETCLLGGFLPYGAALIHLAENHVSKQDKITVSGQNSLFHILEYVFKHLGLEAIISSPATSACDTVIVLEAPNKFSLFNGMVVGIGVPKRDLDRLFPKASKIIAYCLEDLLRDETRNFDIFYDGDIDIPAWLSEEFCQKYVSIVNDSDVNTSTYFSDLTKRVHALETDSLISTDGGVELVGFLAGQNDSKIETAECTVRPCLESGKGGDDIKYVSLIGGGRWPLGMSIRHLVKNKKIKLRYVCDRRPEIGYLASQAFPFEYITTDIDAVLSDEKTDLVVVAPYHGFHAPLAEQVLRAGKSCYVEKPPAVNEKQFSNLFEAVKANGSSFFHVGYNRRFAPATVKLLEILSEQEGPVNISMVIRSVDIPPSSWYYWPSNGNRIVSNVCHFTDFAYLLTGYSQPLSVTATSSVQGRTDENAVVTIKFADGSLATIFYTNKGFQKNGYDQKYQIMKGNMTARITNFEKLVIRQDSKTYTAWSGAEDMGHRSQMYAVSDALVSGKANLISMQNAAMSVKIYLAALESLSNAGMPIHID